MTSNIKQRFLEQLSLLERLVLPSNQYLIFGSGPLAIRAIRESKDIDLLVSKELWNQLKQKHPPSTSRLIPIGNIEIWNDCMNLTGRIDEMIAHPDIIEGFPFMTLPDTI